MTKYVIFFRYDRGEQYEVYWVGDTLKEGKKEFKNQLDEFFGYGPDDDSQLWLCKFKDLTPELVDGLNSDDDEVKSKTIEKLCMGDKTDNDSFGWDRNESKYFDKDIEMVSGEDIFDYLDDLD